MPPLSEHQDQTNTTGDVIAGRYEFEEKLGEGGMGSVFKANDRLLGRTVAVKILNVANIAQDDVVRFHREARAASNIVHPNVIKVLDFGVTDHEQPYMVMEFLNGRSLYDIVKQKGAQPLERSLEIIEQVCNGMIAVHKAGIVHRDLKAGNIMVIEQDHGAPEVKILDFGIAKAFKISQESTLTQKGHILGSPRYMSPEQASGKAVDERSDIYSLGCIAFELITGVPIFVASTALETMALHINVTAPKLAHCSGKTYPEPVEQLVARAVAKETADRFASMLEMKKAVQEALSSVERFEQVQIARPTQPVQKKRAGLPPKVVALSLLGVAVACGAIAMACFKIYDQEKIMVQLETRDALALKPKETEQIRKDADLEYKEGEQLVEGTMNGVSKHMNALMPGYDRLTSQLFSGRGAKQGTLSAYLSGNPAALQEAKMSLLAAPTDGMALLGASLDPKHLDQIEKCCARHATMNNILIHRCPIAPQRLKLALTLKPVQLLLFASNINDEHLKVISESQTLEILLMDMNPAITGSGIQRLKKMPKLRILSLRGCNMNREKMKVLATVTRPEVLFLSDNPKIAPKDLELVLSRKNHTYINVRNTAVYFMPQSLKALELKYPIHTIGIGPPQFDEESISSVISLAVAKHK